ncbi:NAD(P)H-binding protein [Alteromonas sp. 345S023]|uniref:NAD(P)H-binding protein n=1 Tax=Alteromonas profundi TaxID=2696062 RepID=A0A7X5RMA1_9ALTE|nr:NAD(P)H-binding protein [Alteromonas profundi]NDV92551.1 NAD(P)H-binding protein [Alteromonas profundi]
MSNKVVICGYGWLGSYLGAALSPHYSLIATTRDKHKAAQLSTQGIEGVVYQLGDELHNLNRVVTDATLVLNIPPGRKNKDLSDFTQNMLHLIDNAISHKVKHIVFISTTSVYGDSRDGNINIHTPTAPETPSAKAHVKIEQYLLDHATKATIVRLAGLTGPDRHPVKSLSGKHLSAGHKRVNLVHVQDVVSALTHIIETPSTETLFHLCSNAHPKRGEYYVEAAKARGLELPVFEDTNHTASGKCIDATACWETLGISPTFSHPNKMI